MRCSKSVVWGVAAVLFSVSGASADDIVPPVRTWTDDIPVGRPYVKPPVPVRPMTSEQQVAALQPVALPDLAPLDLKPLRIGILEEITRRKADERDPAMSAQLDELGSIYGGEVAGPFWVKEGGFVEAARQAAAEMTRAGDYALDPTVFHIPSLDADDPSALARSELDMSLAIMAYAREAFGLRFEPNSISLWLDNKPQVPPAADLLARVSAAADPGAELRKLHPSHPTFEALRKAYLVATGKLAPEPRELPPQIPDGPVLKVGDDHPDVALVRQRLDLPAAEGKATHFDRELGDEIRAYMRRNGKRRRPEINNDLRALLNRPPPLPKAPDVRVIEANMLRWRWLPRELGEIHVWNNIPEFLTRLYRGGEIIHQERIIVGQPGQQTPIFSDTMEHIVFKPQWGVPNSIKITDLLPRLRGGDHDVLSRRGMKIVKDGREVDAGRIRWDNTDIRYISIVQGPSAWNPLGEMKFMFPNRHSVYMHDTTSKGLFSSSERTFSHGCIRVRNPRKLAEVIFRDVQGWDIERIPELLGRAGEENNTVEFDKKIAVHNVYFTLIPDGAGGLRQLRDVYGHDRRIVQALEGKSLRSIADNDPARIHKRRVEEIERSTRYDNSAFRSASGTVTASDDGESSFVAYRASLGAPRPAANARPQRTRHSRRIVPSWPPQISYD